VMGFSHEKTTHHFQLYKDGGAIQVTVNDPATFSRVWNTQTITFRLLPDTDFIENICENEKDSKVISPQ